MLLDGCKTAVMTDHFGNAAWEMSKGRGWRPAPLGERKIISRHHSALGSSSGLFACVSKLCLCIKTGSGVGSRVASILMWGQLSVCRFGALSLLVYR